MTPNLSVRSDLDLFSSRAIRSQEPGHPQVRAGWLRGRSFALVCVAALFLFPTGAAAKTISTWPQEYTVRRDDAAGRLTLSTPYFTVEHDLTRGGAIASIRLTHGRATNLLVRPIGTRLLDESNVAFTDLADGSARVSQHGDAMTPIVTVQARLLDAQGHISDLRLTATFEYHWGYIKVRKEFTSPSGPVHARELCPFFTILSPSLSEYGYREGITEQEGAPPFSFGSNRWGKAGRNTAPQPLVKTTYPPRSVLVADPGVEGLEWFAGSELWPWEGQLAGRRGQGQFLLQRSQEPPGLELAIAPLSSTNTAVALPETVALEFYLGIPLLEGHALRPWLHTSFNRNRGNWVSPAQIQGWAESGFQTVHCHNDGDYYDDGLFWRDGAYPPYPDMDRYDEVIAGCRRAGIRVATYFSNKELHSSTKEFKEHGSMWGRLDSKGRVQHNFFRGTNEFGVQMCLRSGWLEFLKFSIDRALKNHALDGVYYDWNVALYCCNPQHVAKPAHEPAAGHWDIEELLNLMEWTRRRVGPGGLVIVHNTTTPMFTMENFADHIVANEWGYGAWKEEGPDLDALPLEWSLAGARPRGVISYGQLNAQSPRHLHRLFALEALLGGVTPWPASPETFELVSILKPLGDLERYRFADWRNQAILVGGTRCGSAIYSGPGEAYVLVGNLEKTTQEIRCVVRPEQLPYPLSSPAAATVLGEVAAPDREAKTAMERSLAPRQLFNEGISLTVPANGTVLLHIQ